MTWAEDYCIEEYIRENDMLGYIFEVTNKKTGEKTLGKRCAVAFDKNYFGDVDVEKYGKESFEVKMIQPIESLKDYEAIVLDTPKKKVQPAEEVPVEEKKPAKRGRKKKTEEE